MATPSEPSPFSTFFLVVPPGLEDLACDELNAKWPGLEVVSREKGGVMVNAPLGLALGLCQSLKIPSTILLRVAEFKCRDLPKLYQKVSNIKWARYLVGDKFELSVASSKSRLLNEKKIAKAVREGIERHFAKQPPKQVDVARVLEVKVRFFQDVCTLSIDLCGELLFKRGYKKMGGVAPLRENLAAGLYLALKRVCGVLDVVWDPMCGSGTFLLEAASFYESQGAREFAAQARAEWCEIVAPAREGGSGPVCAFVGCDRDEHNLQNLRESWAAVRRLATTGEVAADAIGDTRPKLEVFVRDVFAAEPPQFHPGARVGVLCNPPYGERLRLPRPPQEYYSTLLKKLLAVNPAGVGIILPQRFVKLVPAEFSAYKVRRAITFENGGIPVEFRIYSRLHLPVE